MTAARVEHLSDSVTLYLGDCREILPTLGKVDAVVTDPPYGIGINKSNRLSVSRGHGGEIWDESPIDAERLGLLLAAAPVQILWGGNYFNLPPTRCFLIWDKNNAGRDFADVELAWTNIDAVARRIIFRPMNMDGGKLHPTQKPIDVMGWCIQQIPPPCDSDPRSLHGLRHNRSGGCLSRPQVHRHRDRAQVFRHRPPSHRRRAAQATAAVHRASRTHPAGGA